MTHTQAFSLEEENWTWLKSTADAHGLKTSTFLNQVIRSAKGELSLLSGGQSNNLSQEVENRLVDVKKTRNTKRDSFKDWLTKKIMAVKSGAEFEGVISQINPSPVYLQALAKERYDLVLELEDIEEMIKNV